MTKQSTKVPVTGENEEQDPLKLEEMRIKLHKFYVEQLPYLNKQFEVEKLQADIEEARLRRMIATVRMAQLMAPPEDLKESPKEIIKK